MGISAYDAALAKEIMAELEDSEPPPTLMKRQLSKIAREEAKSLEREAARDELATIRMAPYTQVTPENVATLRARTMRIVEQRLVDANEVLAGRKVWSGTQVQVFRALLSKVLPDVHHTEVAVGVDTRDLSQLTREELEAIVAKGSTFDATATVVAEDLAKATDSTK